MQLVPLDGTDGQSVNKCHEALVSFPTPGPPVPPLLTARYEQSQPMETFLVTQESITELGRASCAPVLCPSFCLSS